MNDDCVWLYSTGRFFDNFTVIFKIIGTDCTYCTVRIVYCDVDIVLYPTVSTDRLCSAVLGY